MAITQVTMTTDTFYGLSSDTKPTVNIAVGSLFCETDTKNWFVYTSSWCAL